MANKVSGLSYGLSTTQTPSRSSNQLLCDANKHYTPFKTPPSFQPSPFTHEFIQSLGNKLVIETLAINNKKIRGESTSSMNGTNMEPLNLLELIDDIERLGLSFKFEEDINKALLKIVSIENFEDQTGKSPHETALLFGILGRHGFDVSQDLFMSFKDEEGKFKAEISNDVEGMLSLYEASYLSFEGESVWEANAFSRTHPMNLMKEGLMDAKMAEKVSHVLEGLPYHRSRFGLMARECINKYDKIEPHNLLLLELAKLNFNIQQSSYQNELKELSRWWWDIGLSTKLKFVRHGLVESFIWSLTIFPEPQFAICHKELTKVGYLLTILDDIYDIYGTLDELELFTDAIERFVQLIRDGWSNLCKAYLQEAKWFHNKIIPPFNKFLQNARISISGGVILTHSYFFVGKDITEQVLHSLTNHHDMLSSSFTIFGLTNDLATSTDEIERVKPQTRL
ncbi:hypothetical protein ACSQ67_010820 [Phaseolus vulgaris]